MTVASYESELRRAAVREDVLRSELRPLENELASTVGVYVVLQTTLAKLAEAEARVSAASERADTSAEAMRRAQTAQADARQEADDALAEAFAEREARKRGDDECEAKLRRAEREMSSAESAKAAAIDASDVVTRETTAGAHALSEAVDALHRWVDGVVVHGASSSAATLETVQAVVRGEQLGGATMRGAHASLEALLTRLQYVCDEILRSRAQLAKRGDDATRLEAELDATRGRSQQMRRRAEKLEAVAMEAEEATRQAKLLEAAAQKAAEGSEHACRDVRLPLSTCQVGLWTHSLLPRTRRSPACSVHCASAPLAGPGSGQRAHKCTRAAPAARMHNGRAAERCPAPFGRGECRGPIPGRLELHVDGLGADRTCSTCSADSNSAQDVCSRRAVSVPRVSQLSALVSHTAFYWAAHQRELADAKERLKLMDARVREKEESLSRAAAIAAGLKHANAPPGSSRALPWRARGPAGRDHPGCFSAAAAQQREAGFVSGPMASGSADVVSP